MRLFLRLAAFFSVLIPAGAFAAAPTIWTFPVGGFPMYSTDYGKTWTENKTAGASTRIRAYIWQKGSGFHRFISDEAAPYKIYELQGGNFVNVTASTPIGTAAAWTQGDTHANWTWWVAQTAGSAFGGYNFNTLAGISVSSFNSSFRYYSPKTDSTGFGFALISDVTDSRGINRIRRTQTNSPSGAYNISGSAFWYDLIPVWGTPESCYKDAEISVNGDWVYWYKNSFNTSICGATDTDVQRGVWRVKKDGSIRERVFSIGNAATVPVGGSADICQSADGSTVMVVSNWPDRIMLSRKGNAAAGALDDMSYTWPTRDFVACGVSPNGKDLYAVVSDGSVWASIFGSTWREIAPAGTLPSAGSPRNYSIYALGDSTSMPLDPIKTEDTFVFGSGSLSGSGSISSIFGDLPPVSEGYDCSVMFDPETRAFNYPKSESAFSVDTYIFSDSATILGDVWSCPFLVESVDPCAGAYAATAFIVDGVGSAFEYVFSSMIDPVFSLFEYMGTPEAGGRYCFLGDSITVSGKSEDAPEWKTGYDYLILFVVTWWLVYSVMRR